MPISKELLAVLACPLCKETVTLHGEILICNKCGRNYPVKDDIPVMLIASAVPPADSAGKK